MDERFEILFLYFYLAFSASGKRVETLISNFGSLDIAFENKSKIDPEKYGLKSKRIDYFKKIVERKPEEISLWLEKRTVKFLTKSSTDFPKQLLEIPNPPSIIFYRGNFPNVQDEFSLSIVGTRKSTQYGETVLEKIIPELVENGLSIISGLALGVDSLSHQKTLESFGRTVAVLGSGVDDRSIFPQSNLNLAHKIIESGGAIISEYPPNYPSLTQNFPARNRIIAGLSRGVWVVEAPKKSGSLITADFAKKFKRKVFATPGEITRPNSEGAHFLIKSGSKLVESAEDILDDFGIEFVKERVQAREYFPESDIESKIINILKRGDFQVDQISRKAGVSSSEISTAITILELKGVVKDKGGGVYSLLN